MRILVVGGAGYIGSHAVRLFLDRGHETFVYDNLVFGHRGAVPAERLIVGELDDAALLRRTLAERRIDAVVHFAAFAFVGESVTEPAKYWRNNVAATLTLLEACRDAGVKRFVFSSTCATYGVPSSSPIAESCPQAPINPYGRTKLVVEWMLADFAHAYGLGFAALRYFNAAGAHPSGEIGEDHCPETHLILAIDVALGKRPELLIFGTDYPTPDGTCIRDYIHVDDLADAHLRALQVLRPGQALRLNLGTGRGHSVRETVAAVERVSGRPVRVRETARREGDPPALVAAADAARAALDWRPHYDNLDALVATAWNWHSRHRRGYADR